MFRIIAYPGRTKRFRNQIKRKFGFVGFRKLLKERIATEITNNKLVSNYLSLERGYLGLETKFTEQVKGRFTVDIFTTDKTYEYQVYSLSDGTLTSSTKSGSIDGAGLKIKYAYVDFGGFIPVKDMTLTAGMQKVYFGSIYDWSYTLIGKAPSDEHKVVNSSDLGITLNGFFPSGFGEYQLGIYNGEGYKKIGANVKENTDFAYLGKFTPNSNSRFNRWWFLYA